MAKTDGDIKIAQKQITDRIHVLDASIATTVKSEADHGQRKRDALQEAAKYVTEKDLDKHIRAKALADLHGTAVYEDQKTRADLQAKRSALQEELVELNMKGQAEIIRATIAEVAGISDGLSEGVAGFAERCEALEKKLTDIWATVVPFFGPNRERVAPLERSIRESVPQGVKAQLQKSFTPRGIILFDVRKYEGEDFVSIMKRPINDLLAALDSAIHSRSNAPVAGRAMFRAKTVVSGLHGMYLRPGDAVSLEVNHPDVRRMIEAGGLELVSEDKAVSA